MKFWDVRQSVLPAGHYQAWSCSFWMAAFGGGTPKRHRLWSNSKTFLEGIFLQGGSLPRETLKACKGLPLVKKYIDKQGVRRCTGIKDRLKASQHLGLH